MDNLTSELMIQIGDRMTTERQRLNFKQKDVYTALGLGATSLSRYEQGKRTLDLIQAHAFAALGYDMHYVLTGNRLGESASDLTEDEHAWLELYRQADEPTQLMKMAKAYIAAE
ncbi:helix-turn-helix transcriptional regulator [Psychrobacter sp. JB193]|uniref:helix-turn-helix domain-containing protein n=1 Tax=Psychrobacter sp. JB193 TaxID=2024406 RepID=UPI000BAB16C5|nr:helix-turn-helix transcriptional regulator [Psychrobacter sp. JB193]PAT63125.1 hypothetical protein CIK80_11280 [Psychrobacter sp. JB193]